MSTKMLSSKMISCWCAGLLCLLCASAAFGQTFVSGAGSDANTCGAGDPCRTLTRALAVTPPYGDVAVYAGDYEPFRIRRGVTIRAAAGATPRIRLAASAATREAISIALPSGDYAWLDGLTVVDESGGRTQGIYSHGPAIALLLTNCWIEGFETGLRFGEADTWR